MFSSRCSYCPCFSGCYGAITLLNPRDSPPPFGLPPASTACGSPRSQTCTTHPSEETLQALSHKPLIVLTGDLADFRRTNLPWPFAFAAARAAEFCPPLTSSWATTRPGCLNILPSNPG